MQFYKVDIPYQEKHGFVYVILHFSKIFGT